MRLFIRSWTKFPTFMPPDYYLSDEYMGTHDRVVWQFQRNGLWWKFFAFLAWAGHPPGRYGQFLPVIEANEWFWTRQTALHQGDEKVILFKKNNIVRGGGYWHVSGRVEVIAAITDWTSHPLKRNLPQELREQFERKEEISPNEFKHVEKLPADPYVELVNEYRMNNP